MAEVPPIGLLRLLGKSRSTWARPGPPEEPGGLHSVEATGRLKSANGSTDERRLCRPLDRLG